MPRVLFQRSQRLLIWLGVLPGVLAISTYLISARHLESVDNTQQIGAFLRQVERLLTSVVGAETGQRGYLLTGAPEYLSPFHSGQSTVEERISQVIESGRKSGVPERELDRLRAIVEAKMAELNETVRLYQQGDRKAAIAVVNGRGRSLMIELRTLLAKIDAEEENSLRTARTEQQQRRRILEAVLGLGLLFGIGLAILAARLNVQYARLRDDAEEHVRQLVIERTAELEQRTAQLETRTAELQRSNADLAQFAYVSSHDLQEPLRTVASYVGLLARRYEHQLDDKAQTYIRYAVDGAARMQTLISDLLLYSRAGTQDLQVERVPLDSVLDVALANLAATIDETGAIIHRTALPCVMADQRKLTQVFQNLIANSIKFRKPDEKPEIRVGASAGDGAWTVSVEDNGIGFEQKYTNRIFDVFQRLHGTSQYQGNGIGLAVCRRVIEHHGGNLSATSTVGSGSIFFFTLPETDESALRNFARRG